MGNIKNFRAWLERNQIFFETIAAILLGIMAIVVSWEQTRLTKIQTQIAQQQFEREQRIDAIEKTANWGELRNAMWAIMDLYPSSGVKSLQGLSQQDKVVWLIKIRELLDSQIDNPALIEHTASLGQWRNAISVAKTAKEIVSGISPDDPQIDTIDEMFIRNASTIVKDVLFVWSELVLKSDEVSAVGGRPDEN